MTINNYISNITRVLIKRNPISGGLKDIVSSPSSEKYGLVMRKSKDVPLYNNNINNGANIEFDIGSNGNWNGNGYNYYVCVSNNNFVDETCFKFYQGVNSNQETRVDPHSIYSMGVAVNGFIAKDEVTCTPDVMSYDQNGDPYLNSYKCTEN